MTAAVAGVEPRHEWHTLASGAELHAVHWDPPRQAASGDEPVPFLLVHGLASNARLWDGVAQHLAKRGHRVVAIDQHSVHGAALFGLGGGACGILTTGMALRSVSDDDQGMAYAAHQTARRMASSFGLALMATLLGEASGTDLLGGARNVWIMSAAAHLIMIIPLAVTSRKD